MLRVIIVGEGLEIVRQRVEVCQDQYTFELSSIPLSRETSDSIRGVEPLLVFVEAPGETRGISTSNTWVLLKELQKMTQSRLVRAVVTSTGDGFDSDEAQRAWMEHSIVIGYDLKDHLTLEAVRTVLGEMVGMASVGGDPGSELRPVGSVLKMPEGEYARHKFVSIFIGGMREVLVKVRQIAEEMKSYNPVPVVNGKLAPLFGENTSAQDLFDKAVLEMVGGSDKNGRYHSPRGMLRELRELKQKRVEEAIAPHLLLLGETGTGKTLLARWLHRSRFEELARNERDWQHVDAIFQDINCGGTSPNLIDSQLFGGVAGAWTGLNRNTPGKVFCACYGTLFLDEIGELPLSTQAVLLKFLDDGEYYPVGWHGEKLFIPVTVVAATNQPIEELVEKGKFRRDLYERFRFRVRLPSLRERMDHFDHLVDFVLQNPQINPVVQNRREVNAISSQALERLRSHAYSGNFRELEQVIWNAVFQARHESKDTIMAHHIVFSSQYGT